MTFISDLFSKQNQQHSVDRVELPTTGSCVILSLYKWSVGMSSAIVLATRLLFMFYYLIRSPNLLILWLNVIRFSSLFVSMNSICLNIELWFEHDLVHDCDGYLDSELNCVLDFGCWKSNFSHISFNLY